MMSGGGCISTRFYMVRSFFETRDDAPCWPLKKNIATSIPFTLLHRFKITTLGFVFGIQMEDILSHQVKTSVRMSWWMFFHVVISGFG